jgi:hypothetical protein
MAYQDPPLDVRARAAAQLNTAMAAGGWRPQATHQQVLVAAVDTVWTDVRALFVRHLFGLAPRCEDCETVLRVRSTSGPADFLLLCDDADCPSAGLPVARIALQPTGTPAPWSPASAIDWFTALRAETVHLVGPTLPEWSRDCVAGSPCAAGCAHPRDADGGPALPGIVLAAGDGAPVVLLTDSPRSASAVYDTVASGFEICTETVTARDLDLAVRETAAALDPVLPYLTGHDAHTAQLALAAVWARLPWDTWEASFEAVSSCLPDDVRDEARRLRPRSGTAGDEVS